MVHARQSFRGQHLLHPDNCSAIVTSSHDPGDTFPYGSTEVTYVATDPSGNAVTCTFDVIVKNSSDPVITGCPASIIIEADLRGEAMAEWVEPEATVTCGDLVVTKSHEPGSTFQVGTTSVVYEFVDDTGQSSTCSFDIIIEAPKVDITISQVVTPDGDGIHDTWKLENIENYENNSVVVVDRWGNRIYQASGYDNEEVFWDGTNENGTKVPTGTYFYTIEVKLLGTVVKKKGYLEVIQ